MSSSEILWYCCNCRWASPAMLSELYPTCVSCGHETCSDCIHGTNQPTEKKKNRDTKNNEALQSRASSPPVRNTAADLYLPLSKGMPTDLAHSSQNVTEIGLIECSPRSCQWDNFDPSDLVSTVNQDTFTAGLFNTESSFDLGDSLTYQFDLSSGSYPLQDKWSVDMPSDDTIAPLPQLQLDTGSAEAYADESGLEVHKLGASCNYSYSIEPQILKSSFLDGVNLANDSQLLNKLIPNNPQYSTSWTSHPDRQATESYPQDTLIYAPTPRIVNPPHLASKTGPMEYQVEAFSSPKSRRSNSSCSKNGDDEQIVKKRLISQGDRKDGYAGGTAEACESCSAATEPNKDKPLACLFYKRNPDLYASCIFKDFKTISTLRQHLNKDHKLGPYHCTSCWDTFSDKKSLEAHKNCQPTGGIPVDRLPTIYKARDSFSTKWYWTWRKLFGEKTPPPKCPHRHHIQDMKCYNLRQFSRYLASKGTSFTIHEIDDAISKWVASNPKPFK
ncbi:hypothetical protein K449DRAFT_427553 [Hypoxylon sp. EC38]|nr:hypothetical protein K449DRAFT_427553 [Hypoxylon sp. EC38]